MFIRARRSIHANVDIREDERIAWEILNAELREKNEDTLRDEHL